MSKILLVVAVAVIGVAAVLMQPTAEKLDPEPPKWPEKFTQNFTEIAFWASGWYNTRGTMYYDWTNKLMREDRESGQWDKMCASQYPEEDTPCSHFVNQGNRFLYYPDKNDCCLCCNSTSSDEKCGMKSPDWLKNATYMEPFYVHLNNGTYIQAFKWELKPHYYYESMEVNPEDRMMIEWQVIPEDAKFFDFKRSLDVPSDKMDLPSICKVDKKCEKGDECN